MAAGSPTTSPPGCVTSSTPQLSFQPWKCSRSLSSFERPVAVRASRAASIVASVPEATKRTFSAEGINSTTSAAHSTSRSCEAP